MKNVFICEIIAKIGIGNSELNLKMWSDIQSHYV
jgi:hypothetical protein